MSVFVELINETEPVVSARDLKAAEPTSSEECSSTLLSTVTDSLEPQTPTIDDETRSLYRALDDFKCPICLDVFINTVRVDCGYGHKFCNHCIQTWIGTGSHLITECPVCRDPIFGKRLDLKTDADIRAIIDQLSPQERAARLLAIKERLRLELPSRSMSAAGDYLYSDSGYGISQIPSTRDRDLRSSIWASFPSTYDGSQSLDSVLSEQTQRHWTPFSYDFRFSHWNAAPPIFQQTDPQSEYLRMPPASSTNYLNPHGRVPNSNHLHIGIPDSTRSADNFNSYTPSISPGLVGLMTDSTAAHSSLSGIPNHSDGHFNSVGGEMHTTWGRTQPCHSMHGGSIITANNGANAPLRERERVVNHCEHFRQPPSAELGSSGATIQMQNGLSAPNFHSSDPRLSNSSFYVSSAPAPSPHPWPPECRFFPYQCQTQLPHHHHPSMFGPTTQTSTNNGVYTAATTQHFNDYSAMQPRMLCMPKLIPRLPALFGMPYVPPFTSTPTPSAPTRDSSIRMNSAIRHGDSGSQGFMSHNGNCCQQNPSTFSGGFPLLSGGLVDISITHRSIPTGDGENPTSAPRSSQITDPLLSLVPLNTDGSSVKLNFTCEIHRF